MILYNKMETQNDGILPMETLAKPVKPMKTSTKKKRCSRGKRRNPVTKRCNKKCKEGYKRSKTGRRCVKK
jgi:hypothetical protein